MGRGAPDGAHRGHERLEHQADGAHLVARPRRSSPRWSATRSPCTTGASTCPCSSRESMVGHKLGEFAPTRTYRGHADTGPAPMSEDAQGPRRGRRARGDRRADGRRGGRRGAAAEEAARGPPTSPRPRPSPRPSRGARAAPRGGRGAAPPRAEGASRGRPAGSASPVVRAQAQVRPHLGAQGAPRLRPHPRQVRPRGARDPRAHAARGRARLEQAARVRRRQRRAQPRAARRRAAHPCRHRRRGPDAQALPPARAWAARRGSASARAT